MKKYKLIQPYPGKEIGDIAYYNPIECDSNFLWEKGGKIPQEFQPDMNPKWFELLPYVTFGSMVIENVTIHTVKKISDGEIFKIGDKARSVGKKNDHSIRGFEIRKKQGANREYYGEPLIWVNWEKESGGNWLEDIEKSNNPIFISHDGVEIFKDNNIWAITEQWNIQEKTVVNKINWVKSFSKPLFYHKENAKKYVIENSPSLSLAQLRVIKAANFGLIDDKLLDVLEKRLNEIL